VYSSSEDETTRLEELEFPLSMQVSRASFDDIRMPSPLIPHEPTPVSAPAMTEPRVNVSLKEKQLAECHQRKDNSATNTAQGASEASNLKKTCGERNKKQPQETTQQYDLNSDSRPPEVVTVVVEILEPSTEENEKPDLNATAQNVPYLSEQQANVSSGTAVSEMQNRNEEVGSRAPCERNTACGQKRKSSEQKSKSPNVSCERRLPNRVPIAKLRFNKLL